jgi:Seed maturation protein
MDVQPQTETHELSFAELAASGDPSNLAQAAMAAPPLSTFSKADAAAIESAAMRAHGGTIDKGSFASLAQSVADANEGKFTLRADVVPPYAGGDAAAARAADFNVVASALRGTAYDLDFITRARAQELESAAAKAHRGTVEKGSYASRAQVIPCSLYGVARFCI